MRITLNGEPRCVADGLTLAGLLKDVGVVVERVAVEHNRRVVPRNQLAAQPLADGDVIEIVTFVGGGNHVRY